MEMCAPPLRTSVWDTINLITKRAAVNSAILNPPAVVMVAGDTVKVDSDNFLTQFSTYRSQRGYSNYSGELRFFKFCAHRCKAHLYIALRQPKDSVRDGLAKYPDTYGDEWWKELSSQPYEKVISPRSKKTVMKFLEPKGGQRDEALDLYSQNLACAEICYSALDFNALTAHDPEAAKIFPEAEQKENRVEAKKAAKALKRKQSQTKATNRNKR